MAGHQPEHGHDTGGVPWHGRDLTPNPFSSDTGEPDPHLQAALRHPQDEPALLRAVARARMFVPVVAAPGDEAEAGTDSVAEMATVVLTSADGDRALPAFTSLEALHRWDPAARPVPVTALTLAQAAVQESCDALLLDLGSPLAVVLRASMVFALAQGREWVPAHEDVVVQEAVAEAHRAVTADPETGDVLHGLRPLGLGTSGELRVGLLLAPGLDRPALARVLDRVGSALAADVDLRTRIDGLSFVVQSG